MAGPRDPRRLWMTTIALAAAGVVVVAGGLLFLSGDRDRAASQASAEPSTLASPSTAPPSTPASSASASPTPSATATIAAGVFENRVLAYRIAMPTGYRRASAIVLTGQESMGGDFYTPVTEAAEREQCAHDIGHIFPSTDLPPDISVSVSRNSGGVSPAQYATTPQVPGGQPLSMHKRVEPVTVAGLPAVRLVWEQTGESDAYVIPANGRLYTILKQSDSLPSKMPARWFDDIATSFAPMPLVPFPSPTATVAPRIATADVAQQLAQGLVAKDVDAIARVITPRCWLSVYSTAPSGGLGRAVPLFLARLREGFAKGSLSVVADASLQVETNGFGEILYFIRSTWTESGTAKQIDLIFREVDGRWYWGEARHHDDRGANFSCLWAGTFYPNCPP